LFDLSHPDLPVLLNKAIDISLYKHESLTFLDQCALNIAFRERTTLLPAAFNAFIREKDRLDLAAPEPVVWHFLDRPKPWDPMYRSVNCMRWIRELAALGQILPADCMKQLLSIPFMPGRSRSAAANSLEGTRTTP
jgi:lipopolysaccharide biosynthesis glycosyltransferase